MRILHIASFQGNIGDRANHIGFRPWFERLIGEAIEWLDLEIREVYRGNLSFRDSVKELAETADLIIAGGGGFWELWPERNDYGNSLDFSPSFLEELDRPVFFNALGVDLGQGISHNALARFPDFVDYLQRQKKYLVSVRNDGSMKNLVDLGCDVSDVWEIPDHAFFAFQDQLFESPEVGSTRLVVSLAVDMPEIRFRGGQTRDSFLSRIARLLEEVTRENDCLTVFVPHIYSDLSAIAEVLALSSDAVRRERYRVAALETSQRDSLGFLKEYHEASAVASMRFHGNVLGLASGARTVALDTYPKVSGLAQGLIPGALPAISVNDSGFDESLIESLNRGLQENVGELRNSKKAYLDSLARQRESFGRKLRSWVENHTGSLQ